MNKVLNVEGKIKGGTIEVKTAKPKIVYSERETRLIVAWCMITFAVTMLVQWAIATTGNVRPQYIVDLLLPAFLAVTGVYILRKKIPEK